MNDDCIALVAPRYGNNLITLSLYGCEDITDATLIHLTQHCRQLEQVDFGGCSITDMGLSILSLNFPHLKTIVLRKCANISDAGLLHLSRNLSKLVTLALSETSVSDSVLQALTVNNPHLIELELTGCRLVTKAGVRHVISSIPGINCTNFWSNYL